MLAAWRAGTVAESSHIDWKDQATHTHCEWQKVFGKSKPSIHQDTLAPTRLCPRNLPKQFHELGTVYVFMIAIHI